MDKSMYLGWGGSPKKTPRRVARSDSLSRFVTSPPAEVVSHEQVSFSTSRRVFLCERLTEKFEQIEKQEE
jgi:hypothetical protein